MLVEFRIANFQSIKTEQVLNLQAVKPKKPTPSLYETGVPSHPFLLRSALVYGANASGKTTIVRALQTMQAIVRESASQSNENSRLPITPFLLDPLTAAAPSLFELTILLDGVRYQYGFKATADRVLAEWLLVYEKNRPQVWFDRKADPSGGSDAYEFSTFFKGQKDVWKKATRSNALFLSTATQLNSDQLKGLFNWIVESLVVFPDGEISQGYTAAHLDDPAFRDEIIAFMNATDFGIDGIAVERRRINALGIGKDPISGKRVPSFAEREVPFPRFRHKTESGSAEFSYEAESRGTQRVFSLSAPILDILAKGCLLIVDELENSLHPLLLKRVIEYFMSPIKNPRGAQLIATTHNTSLLKGPLVARDQVWFTEKDRSLATSLYPLSDFAARTNEAVEKGYLEGRYGALPLFPDDLEADELVATECEDHGA